MTASSEIRKRFDYLFLNESITLCKGERTVDFIRLDLYIAIYNQKHPFGGRYRGNLEEQKSRCIRYAQQLLRHGYRIE